jgi:hypothetical protein
MAASGAVVDGAREEGAGGVGSRGRGLSKGGRGGGDEPGDEWSEGRGGGHGWSAMAASGAVG